MKRKVGTQNGTPALLAMLALLGFCTALAAGEAVNTEESDLLAIAQSHVKCEVVLQALKPLVENAWQDTWRQLDDFHAGCDKALNGIRRKLTPQDQDQRVKLDEQQQQLNEEWPSIERERQAMAQRNNEAREKFQGLMEMFNSLENVERSARRARVVLKSVAAVYDSMKDAAVKQQQQAQQSIDDLKVLGNRMKARLDEIEAFVKTGK